MELLSRDHRALWIPGRSAIALLALLLAATFPVTDGTHTPGQDTLKPNGDAFVHRKPIAETYRSLPLSFEPNQGQTDPRVRFICRSPGYTLFLMNNEVILDFSSRAGRTDEEPKVLRVALRGSNPAPVIKGREVLPGKSNYFTGNDPHGWLTDIPNYGKIEYEEIYPGVDLLYYGNQGELEYDFVVAPGADYNTIRLAVTGADDVKIDSSGNLELQGGAAGVRILRPHVYQDGGSRREDIAGEFVLLNETEIGFHIAAYDPGRPLIIDPVVTYSYWTGDGTADEQGACIAIDNNGNAYITGSSRFATFPLVNAFQSTLGTGGNSKAWDAFVTKVNASGTALVYSTFLGSYYDDAGADIAVDASGCAYVVGATRARADSVQTAWNECFPLKNPLAGKYFLDTAGTSNIFVTKLSAAGNELVYSTLLGGTKDDGDLSDRWARVAVAVDGSGAAIVAGDTDSWDFPVLNPFRSSGGGFLTKLNPSGAALEYSTYLGSSDVLVAQVLDLAVDKSGNAYVAGSATGVGGGNVHAFLQKVNPSGSSPVYTKMYAGTQIDVAEGVAVDSSGNVILGGYTYSNDFPLVNAYQSTFHGNTEAFILKVDASGQTVFSTYLGGSAIELGYDISVDRAGNAYLTGSTTSPDFPTANPSQPAMGGGGWDAYVSCLNSAGNQLLFSTFLGGNGWEFGHGIAVEPAGAAYALGWSASSDFPTTVTKTFPRGIYVVKFASATPMQRVQVWQELRLSSSGSFRSNPDSNVVTFDGIKAKIIRANPDTVSALVPPELVKNRTHTDVVPDTTTREVAVVARVIKGAGDTVKVLESKCLFVPPALLIHDEVTRSAPPLLQGVLQDKGWGSVQTYMFMGYRTDGMAAVRLTNTSTAFPPPISLLAKVISPPPVTWFDGSDWPSVGNLLNVGNQNAAIQFPIDKDGWYIVVVLGGPLPNPPVTPEVPNSPGPFPAQFQIHLAGNVGLPRKFVNDTIEAPRGIRLDTYFNHPAPRTETLMNNGLVAGEWAETGLFKFANPLSVSRFPIAVLIPPTLEGFPIGRPPVRAAAPLRMGQLPNGAIDITVPMAATPGAADPVPGTVIDLAQVPIPASVLGPGPPPGMANILGAPNGSGVTLPYTATAGTISSVIVDMGSGNEIVDGSGADFRVIALSGTYQVAVSNTPFSETFVARGSGTDQQDFDLAGSGLTSARYVRLTVATGTASLDAVEALHLFTDQIHETAGPLADVGWATITMRNRKSPSTALDPFLELIGPDGSSLGRDDSGFGDDLDPDRSDAALIKIALTQQGFHRFLGRGYDTRPDAGALGTYYARLETGGEYDPQEITVSGTSESLTVAQRQGIISLPRQRDSYLFQASSGTALKIVVNGVGTTGLADPLVELYDPEDFLIAANDNYAGRGKNSALSVTLPTTGQTFPDPSTYRIVVTGVDTITGATTSLSNSVYHVRQANGSKYELKVFSGALAGAEPQPPTIAGVAPNIAIQGATGVSVTLTGANFANGASVAFSGSGITVKSVSFLSGSQLNAAMDIDATAPTGKRDVTVTNPDGKSVTTTGVFEVRASVGSVSLQWDTPDPGVAQGPPRNLRSTQGTRSQAFSGGKTLKPLRTQTGGKVKSAATRLNVSQASLTGQSRAAILDEIEPNNTLAQAQHLTGDTLIMVKGRAEIRDSGQLEGWFAHDDIEDLFSVTTSSSGLSIRLDGFVSDCDLYLFDPADTSYVDGTATYGATAPEEIDLPLLPAGTYIIGVTLFDSDPIGPDSTVYTLHVRGEFADGDPTTLTSYVIYRSTMPNARQTGIQVGTVGAGASQWTDALPHVGRFYYQVSAMYGQAESSPSNEATETITFVSPGEELQLPVSVVLLQNYPNPFNPSTTITYGLPCRSAVKLTVFNTLGQQVVSLVDGEKEAGYHEVILDGRNLSSGVYLYRLRVYRLEPSIEHKGGNGPEDFVATRKLCVIR